MIRPDPDDDTRRDRMPRGWQDDRWSRGGCGWDGWQASGWNGRPRPRMRLPRPLRMALLAVGLACAGIWALRHREQVRGMLKTFKK